MYKKKQNCLNFVYKLYVEDIANHMPHHAADYINIQNWNHQQLNEKFKRFKYISYLWIDKVAKINNHNNNRNRIKQSSAPTEYIAISDFLQWKNS